MTTITRTFLVLASLAMASSLFGQTEKQKSEYYDLGGYHYETSTDSKEAQVWFDRGLAMCFGFNHEEAVRCFEKAAAADPGMAMAYWGIAYAWGPNFNNMEIDAAQLAKADFAIRLAQLHQDSCTPLERKLIAATAKRQTTPVPEDRTPLNEAYANALRELHSDYSHDPLVVGLYAESLMNLQPWLHWDSNGKPATHTRKIVRVLEDGLSRWPSYPSLCHFYIHAMEASPTPEKALTAANQLRKAMPGQGHLLHMPSHIDIWLGDYQNVIKANQNAIEADVAYLQREGAMNFYSLYRIHNYHFLVYGAMFDGQSELALQAARKIPEQIPEEMLRAQTDFLDAFMPTDLHVLVRFGRWDEILKQPKPADYLPVSRSIWHYARALAFAATERVGLAVAEEKAFAAQVKRVPETSFLFQNPSRQILAVAEEMVAGEIAYRQGKFDKAFKHLREAVRRDDALNYDEPWGWMQPARHALGALMLEQNRPRDAETYYRQDLVKHPNNPWALHGLSECLEKLGKSDEASKYRKKFELASARCDVRINRSCFCRLQVAD